MRIFVINLEKNLSRLQRCMQQVERCGLNCERFSAIDGRTLSAEEIKKAYISSKAMRLNGRDLSLGELGCALSHIEIYKKMCRENIPYALILEDDAYVLPTLSECLKGIERTISETEPVVILVGEGGDSQTVEGRLYLPFSVYALNKTYGGVRAHAYVITLESAKRLSDFLYPVAAPADCWNRIVKYGIVKIYSLDPFAVGLDCSEESTITEWKKQYNKRSFIKKWIRRIWRYYWLKYDQFQAMIYRCSH